MLAAGCCMLRGSLDGQLTVPTLLFPALSSPDPSFFSPPLLVKYKCISRFGEALRVDLCGRRTWIRPSERAQRSQTRQARLLENVPEL